MAWYNKINPFLKTEEKAPSLDNSMFQNYTIGGTLSNVSPSDVQVAGVSLSGIVRSGATTISGNLTIPSGASPGAKDVVVSFTTPRGTIQLTGTGLFSFQ